MTDGLTKLQVGRLGAYGKAASGLQLSQQFIQTGIAKHVIDRVIHDSNR